MHWFGSLVSSKAVLLRGVKPEWILKPYLKAITIVLAFGPWAQDLLDAIESGR